MKKSVALLILAGLSTAALAAPKGMTGTPNGADNSGSFSVCKMPLLNRGTYVEKPCGGETV